MCRTVAVLAFVLVCTVAPPRASANTCDEPDGCPWMLFPMSAIFFVVGDVAFFAAEIAYARRVLPPEWSIPELVFGAATAGLGGAMLGVGLADPTDPTSDLLYPGAAVAFAFGGWFIGHAIGSLIHHASERAPPVRVTIDAAPSGARVHATARF